MKKGKRCVFDICVSRAVNGTEFIKDSKWCKPYKMKLIKYENYIKEKIKKNPEYYNLDELKGKVLGCWCINTNKIEPLICHAQILLKLIMEKNGIIINKKENKKLW